MITNPVLSTINTSGSAAVPFLQRAIPAAIEILFVVGAVVFFFMLVIGAIQWIASGGDKGAIEAARGKIVNAIIGIVILFAVFAVVTLIGKFFNVNLLNLTIPNFSNSSGGGGNTCTGFVCQGPTHCEEMPGGLPHCVNN